MSKGKPEYSLGEVAEWSKAHAWKVCVPCGTGPRVRIPLSPQHYMHVIIK
jgi:hypothetical protein